MNKPIAFLNTRLAGRLKLVAHKLDGRSRVLADWFPNLITDQGLNRIGTGSYRTHCHVGSGNNEPAVTDTELEAFVAATSTIQATVVGASASAPYFGWHRKTYRFPAGAAAGNLSEVAICWGPSGSVAFARALIKDEFGAPTTVTVEGDEFLDVVHELRNYAPPADSAVVTLPAEGDDYDLFTRASNVTAGDSWAPLDQAVALVNPGGASGQYVYSGGVGTVTAAPSGLSSARTTGDNLAYGNNNLYRDFLIKWELNDGNLAGGVRAFFVRTSLGAYQVDVTPAMPKNGDKVLTATFRLSWSRYVA